MFFPCNKITIIDYQCFVSWVHTTVMFLYCSSESWIFVPVGSKNHLICIILRSWFSRKLKPWKACLLPAGVRGFKTPVLLNVGNLDVLGVNCQKARKLNQFPATPTLQASKLPAMACSFSFSFFFSKNHFQIVFLLWPISLYSQRIFFLVYDSKKFAF